jgi:hypothetical protein
MVRRVAVPVSLMLLALASCGAPAAREGPRPAMPSTAPVTTSEDVAPTVATTGPSDARAVDIRAADTRRAGTRPVDTRPADTRPAHADPADARPFGAALTRAKGYLIQSVRPDGKFTYEYDPETDLDSGYYNILRHAGTAYAMLELYDADRDPRLLAAAERAIDYLLKQVKPGRHENTACVVEDGWVKLGGNALAAVALAEHARVTGDRRHLKVALDLGRSIVLAQEASGRFASHKERFPGGQRSDFVSAYYPGEAILALARLHALDPDGPWMAKAHRAAGWLIRVRDAGHTPRTVAHDHWLLYALGELYRDRPDRAYADHALLITRAILDANVAVRDVKDEQSGGEDEGGDGDGESAADDAKALAGGANQIATRIEGLCAAHPLLVAAGEDAAAAEVRAALARAADALAGFQFSEQDAARFPNPPRVAGGFRASETSDVIRIDTVQHSVSALLGAGRVTGAGEGTAEPPGGR